MNLANLYLRVTHKYADGWRHLDDDQFVGTVKVLGVTSATEGGDYDDGGTASFRVVAPSALRGADLSRAIADTLGGGSNCRHEHDCCGCASTYATVRRVSNREYAVRLRTSFNY